MDLCDRIIHVLESCRGMDVGSLPDIVCRRYRVTMGELLGKRRWARMVRARHVLWAAMRQATGSSYPELGWVFGTDHASVMYGVKSAAEDEVTAVLFELEPTMSEEAA